MLILEYKCQRIGYIQFRVIGHSGQYQSKYNIQTCAYDQCIKHRPWEITLRILAFLSRSGYSIKADIGKENCGHSTHDTRKTIRHKIAPVARANIKSSGNNDKQDNGELHENHNIIGCS